MIVNQVSSEFARLLITPYCAVLYDVRGSYFAFFPNKPCLGKPQQSGRGAKAEHCVCVCVSNFHLKIKICLTLENKAIKFSDEVFVWFYDQRVLQCVPIIGSVA